MEQKIIRDQSHEDQIERWAIYVRDHPKEWKGKVKPFLDGQIIMARRFYKNLSKTTDGKEKIERMWGRK
ncbi:hypothetical protein COU57_02925 [Candidatus Pacearchaeota archaeon CG10_big_fil_rev_8_21_14_0_10_32_14]|nr:MAG: hypothetical protein COU57_02925 [Candidatus Pacearchaeota archaeon CG10_big_fil_rev_8_21_14_0_10_32_14]